MVVNAWRDGKPVSGRKELRRGERMFFLQPGEELEGNRVKNVVVLVEDEALLLRATEVRLCFRPIRYIPSAFITRVAPRWSRSDRIFVTTSPSSSPARSTSLSSDGVLPIAAFHGSR